MVVLRVQLDSVPCKPFGGAVVVKFVKQFFQQIVAAWIYLLQRRDALKSVGDVAASAAGHREFVQRMYARLIDRHVGLGVGLLDIDGAIDSRRATANYRYFGYLFQFFVF